MAKRKVAKKEENIAHKVLLENLISEKSTLLAAAEQICFQGDEGAGKFQIKEAIEGYYGVQVVSVNTIKINPKKRIHGRTIGWKKGFKKAIVTLQSRRYDRSGGRSLIIEKLCQSRYTRKPVPDAEIFSEQAGKKFRETGKKFDAVFQKKSAAVRTEKFPFGTKAADTSGSIG